MTNYDKSLKQNTVVTQQLYQQSVRGCTHETRHHNDILVSENQQYMYFHVKNNLKHYKSTRKCTNFNNGKLSATRHNNDILVSENQKYMYFHVNFYFYVNNYLKHSKSTQKCTNYNKLLQKYDPCLKQNIVVPQQLYQQSVRVVQMGLDAAMKCVILV